MPIKKILIFLYIKLHKNSRFFCVIHDNASGKESRWKLSEEQQKKGLHSASVAQNLER